MGDNNHQPIDELMAQARARLGVGAPGVAVAEEIEEIEEEETPEVAEPEAQTSDSEYTWESKPPPPSETVVPCIVIDRNQTWHDNVLVDLKGKDVSASTWIYYGKPFPVLVEKENGTLVTWELYDVVGGSSAQLYVAANPEGWRSAWTPISTLMEKVKTGAMIALVIALLFLIFIIIKG